TDDSLVVDDVEDRAQRAEGDATRALPGAEDCIGQTGVPLDLPRPGRLQRVRTDDERARDGPRLNLSRHRVDELLRLAKSLLVKERHGWRGCDEFSPFGLMRQRND